MVRVLRYTSSGGPPLVDKVWRPDNVTRRVPDRISDAVASPLAIAETLDGLDVPRGRTTGMVQPASLHPVPEEPSVAAPEPPATIPQPLPDDEQPQPQQPQPQRRRRERDRDGEDQPRRRKPAAGEPPDRSDDTQPQAKPSPEPKDRQQGPSRVRQPNIGATGTIRNKPISPRLESVLDQAARAAGVDEVRVFSGGQDVRGRGARRTGSTRHDAGGAADVDLFKGGRKLDPADAQDRATMSKFIEESARRGATGIGGPSAGYMGASRLHVGFGRTATWHAPAWVRQAHARGLKRRTEGTTDGIKSTGTVADRVKLLHGRLMTGLGINSAQASGVIGSLMGESGTSLNPSARNPSSGAFGIAQWLGKRLTGLRAFARARGKSPADFDTQVDFLIAESRGPERRALSRLKAAGTASEAAAVWTRLWERPSASEIRRSLPRRQRLADQIENMKKK